jgi:tRNA U55 pseudouridine synthase TruB
VGEFTLDQAAKLDDLERAAAENDLPRYVIPLEQLLCELPSVTLQPALEQRVRHGSKFSIETGQIRPGRTRPAPGETSELDSGEWKPARLRVFNQQEKLIAIAQAIVPRTYQPVLVLDEKG